MSNSGRIDPPTRKCRSCGELSLKPIVVDYSADMEYDGRAYSFIVPGLEILECESCHERVLPDDALNQIIARLRTEAGLLSPAEIRDKRLQLKLTQEELANYLKVASETLARWETGGQIQQRHADMMLRAFFEIPELRKHLGMPTGPDYPRERDFGSTGRQAAQPVQLT